MTEVSVAEQILAGGTSLILLVGLIYVWKAWLKDREIHKEERKEDHEEHISEYRTFAEETLALQTRLLERVADALDRNTAAFDRLGSAEQAEARQLQIIELLTKAHGDQ
jgi:hypothetical protein